MELRRGIIKIGFPVTCDICGKKVMEYMADGKRVYCLECAKEVSKNVEAR